MDRLTKFDSSGVPTIPPENASLAVGKLWNLENAEAQGRLIELPFSFGDQIFEVCNDGVERKIIQGTVMGFTVFEDYLYIVANNGISLNAARLGETVFKTYDEAIKKLKEMEDEDGTLYNS